MKASHAFIVPPYAVCISLCFLVFFLADPGRAAFPTAYSPDGSRPRLWLTSERLSELNAARLADTPQWRSFQHECQSLLGEDPWDGVQTGVAYMALMYRLTGDTQYANRAFDFMDRAEDDSSACAYDVAHTAHEYLALGYDWLYDLISANATRKANYIQKMTNLSADIWENYNDSGTGGSSQDTDAIIVSGSQHLMLGCALYGDTAAAADMLDRAWMLWERGQGLAPEENSEQRLTAHPIRTWVAQSIGGHYPTGFLYFMGTDGNGLSNYYTSLRTACGYDVPTREPNLAPFWPNVIRTLLDMTDPSRAMLHHTGDWQDPWGFNELQYLNKLIAIAGFESTRAGQPLWDQYARSYLATVDSNDGDPFREFYYCQPSLTPLDPYAAGLPTTRFCAGADFAFFRDSWDTSAVWGLFSGQGSFPADHQNPDMGNFVLYRENDYLTKDRRCYSSTEAGPFFNNLAIQNRNPMGSALPTGCEGPAAIERYRDGNANVPAGLNGVGPFAYAMMQADDQWDEDPNQWEPVIRVNTYRRHFFWAGDYAVVFDRLRTTDSGWSLYRLHADTEPSLSGTTISQLSSNGQHKLLHRTLEPANCSFAKVNETTAWQGVYEDYEVSAEERLWHYAIQPPDSDSMNMLSTMQMGPASLSDFDGLEHISTAGSSGAKLGGWCVVFASEEEPRDSAAYVVTAPAAGLKHLVCDLKPGVWALAVNGVASGRLQVKDGDNTALFATAETQGPLNIALNWSGQGGMPWLYNGLLLDEAP